MTAIIGNRVRVRFGKLLLIELEEVMQQKPRYNKRLGIV